MKKIHDKHVKGKRTGRYLQCYSWNSLRKGQTAQEKTRQKKHMLVIYQWRNPNCQYTHTKKCPDSLVITEKLIKIMTIFFTHQINKISSDSIKCCKDVENRNFWIMLVRLKNSTAVLKNHLAQIGDAHFLWHSVMRDAKGCSLQQKFCLHRKMVNIPKCPLIE